VGPKELNRRLTEVIPAYELVYLMLGVVVLLPTFSIFDLVVIPQSKHGGISSIEVVVGIRQLKCEKHAKTV
jgi:hypothetical protein